MNPIQKPAHYTSSMRGRQANMTKERHARTKHQWEYALATNTKALRIQLATMIVQTGSQGAGTLELDLLQALVHFLTAASYTVEKLHTTPKLRLQSKPHVTTNGRALEEQCMLIYAEKQAEHKQSKRLLNKIVSGHCLLHLCTSHRSFCLLSARMCWGTQQCNLTQTATHAHLLPTQHFT